ncbi:MAG: Holliday junction resolvase RuvX [Puniceicoccales bacterium]|nr:Holliday junction resolvase RuvX [Puniceicoccales bacterium]
MRYLAIDYGSRRTGLALGEDEPGVAVPIAPILGAPWIALERTIRTRRVDAVVLGHPLGPDGQEGSWARRVRDFGRQLEERFGLPVHLSDEHLTSWAVEREMAMRVREAGLAQLRRQRRSGLADSRAAALLLQEFLDGRRRENGARDPVPARENGNRCGDFFDKSFLF